MRHIPNKLIQTIRATVELMDYKFIGLQLLNYKKSEGLLRVYIDRENNPVTLDDCELVSYQLTNLLSIEYPVYYRYILEISSPGLDRPIFFLEHYNLFLGREVMIQLLHRQQGRLKFRGEILLVKGNKVMIKENNNIWSLPFENIDSARLVPVFN